MIDSIETEMESRLPAMPTLEAAAQALTTMLFERFEDSAVLVRAFVTVPYVRLPASNQNFVLRLAGAAAERLIRPQTPILSLVGTRGVDPRWNSRHDSVGHVGIPLATTQFVESVPMIARLLKEMGATLEWARDLDTAIVTLALGRIAGAFHVPEASATVDAQGRKIIVAQDFVMEHGVRTVFGFGGAYPVARTFLAVVLFTREAIEKQNVERFMRLANGFKAATMRVALENRIFDTSAASARGTQAG